MSTLLDLLGDVARMIGEHEIELALERINQAQGRLDRVSLQGRQDAILELNKGILMIRLQQQAIEKSIQQLPERYRLDVAHHLGFVVAELCHKELTGLLQTKRTLAKPERPTCPSSTE